MTDSILDGTDNPPEDMTATIQGYVDEADARNLRIVAFNDDVHPGLATGGAVMTDTGRRFATETAEHAMIVAHDDGLYRHLQFRHTGKNYLGYYWFDIVTVPGALFFHGDGDGFSFRRLADMFEFFRSSAYLGRPNVGYWAEKLAGPNERQVMKFSPDMVKTWVANEVRQVTADGLLPGLAEAVQRDIFDAEEFGWDDETTTRRLLEDFAHYENEDDRYDPNKRPDFQFSDTWEVSFQDYDWWFLWSLEAILWGIGKYDELHGRKSNYVAAPATVVDVELPDVVPVPAVVTADVSGGAL